MLTTRYHLDEAHLKHYDEKLKSWALSQPVKTIPSRLYPWTQTAKAGAVTCWPVGGTELKPAVDFLFTEVPPASGDKGPENPSTITGVSSVKVTRCGKNLCPLIGESSSSYISVSFTDDGEFVFNGSYVGIVNVYVFNKANNKNLFPNYLERGKTYTFSLQGDNSSVSFDVYRYHTTNYGVAVVSIAPGESQTYTIPNTQSMILRFNIPAGTVLDNAKFKLQIEEGSFATEFEPYAGTDYTIPLGNTYYGGEIDLATGLMTVTYEAYEFSGSTAINNIEQRDNGLTTFGFRFSSQIQNVVIASNSSTCTHFLRTSDYASGVDGYHFSKIRLYIDSTTIHTGADFSAWLADQKTAGTPVTVVFPLETPYIVQLTPTEILSLAQADKYTPRLNTVYTDASAVQVGYVKNPIREEYELTQAIVAQGGEI